LLGDGPSLAGILVGRGIWLYELDAEAVLLGAGPSLVGLWADEEAGALDGEADGADGEDGAGGADGTDGADEADGATVALEIGAALVDGFSAVFLAGSVPFLTIRRA